MNKKVKVRVHGRWFLVELEEVSENTYTAYVEGEEFLLSYMDSRDGSLFTGDFVSDPEPVAQKSDGIGKTNGPIRSLRSPMPGTIQEILVTVGDTFKKGDQICLLESMKMQQVVRAESDGMVEAIKVFAGDSVLDGAVILEYSV
jgi:biotin carboxyl carrier protein